MTRVGRFGSCSALIGILALFRPQPALADVVVPSADVTTRVIVRASASAQSAQIGSLRPGEQLELTGSVPNWHEVRLPNGTPGFISKRWTRVVPTSPGPPPPPPPVNAPTFTLDVVDVGTGLAVLVRGQDFTLVYDAGSNDDTAVGPSNRMLAYMKAVAPTVKTIDQMILSHPHSDHVILLPDLFGAYEVRQVYDSGAVNDICGYRAFLTAIANEAGVQYHDASHDFGTSEYTFPAKPGCTAQTLHVPRGSRITDAPIALGQSASMTILHADGDHHASFNDNSLVVRLDLGGTRVLLMGDAQGGNRASPATPPTTGFIEETLVTCCASELAADVMVVGHHGSRTSSRTALLNAVGASTFLVSSGPTKYGTNGVVLPDGDVIAELTLRGSVFRTDTTDAFRMGTTLNACETNTAKIGPDNDGRAGGCDNLRVQIGGTPAVQVSVFHGVD